MIVSLALLLPIIPANRLVGVGILPRTISLPIACLVVGTCLTLALHREWWWVVIFGALFAVGRGPAVSNGFKLVDGSPLDHSRDRWTTRWITSLAERVAGGPVERAWIWAYTRIMVYYVPFFIAVGFAAGSLDWRPVAACSLYAAGWACCYGLVKSLWDRMKLPVTENCFTNAAEWGSCVCFALCLRALV